MTSLSVVPDFSRDRWHHSLNHAAHRLSKVREALGVVGAMRPQGTLEGIALDLARVSVQIRDMQIDVAAELKLANRSKPDGS